MISFEVKVWKTYKQSSYFYLVITVIQKISFSVNRNPFLILVWPKFTEEELYVYTEVQRLLTHTETNVLFAHSAQGTC